MDELHDKNAAEKRLADDRPARAEQAAKFLGRATHSLSRRLFGDSQIHANLAEGFLLVKLQHDGAAIGLAEPRHRFIEAGLDALPFEVKLDIVWDISGSHF